MTRFLLSARTAVLALTMAFLALFTTVARADSQDIAAAARSVVRVALVATKGESAYFVGHGSGIVVAPDKVLTNAHVVEMVRNEPNIVIGIVPAEGTQSYGAKIIAFSPGNDLALLQITGGTLTPATFFASTTQDGQSVVAIGYPGNVDRAQGMSLSDIIQPMSPVKTSGTVSSGRSSKQYDTVLHTAPMAAGNSGGPLVDTCGRVLGVNSFGSISDGNDAEYGFAVSFREVASFLRQANVQPLRTIQPCRSLADIDAAERVASDKAQLEAQTNAAASAEAVRERALRARLDAEQSIIGARENHLAVAAVLLALSVLSAGAIGLALTQGKPKHARYFGIAAGLLLVGAILAFFLRPGFGEIDDRAAEIAKNMAADDAKTDGGKAISASASPVGDNICHIDLDRSRVTVSDTSDVALNWQPTGCLNGKTQLAQSGERWSRVFVPKTAASVSIRSFEPTTGTYRADNYALDAMTADSARKTRATLRFQGCTTKPAEIDALTRMEADIRTLLPPEPNERLVYHCTHSAQHVAASPTGEE